MEKITKAYFPISAKCDYSTCIVIEKAFSSKKYTQIFVIEAEEEVNKRLWTFSSTKFIPHVNIKDCQNLEQALSLDHVIFADSISQLNEIDNSALVIYYKAIPETECKNDTLIFIPQDDFDNCSKAQNLASTYYMQDESGKWFSPQENLL